MSCNHRGALVPPRAAIRGQEIERLHPILVSETKHVLLG